ncbi:hypothetical protein CkaCkLH20_09074 [Colletotrichum karsti]|uniref:Uncharacterized protein n=1 Tax=Colletotrichum karsti TaxID=1095194 RepID=A0A9P6I3E3_9PEZI|nr:uncharacterized protein CkaCkLH20_09074 [Colletotrichum karsti]KAF9873261.1 hypothetical protein CkaCkLH20_09074 [Colletotrichum karsti]
MGSGSKALSTQQHQPSEDTYIPIIKGIVKGIHGLKFPSGAIIAPEARKTFMVLFYEPEPLEPLQPLSLSDQQKSLLAASRATVLLETAIELISKPHGSVLTIWRAGAKELLQKKFGTANINPALVATVMNALVRARQSYLKQPTPPGPLEASFGPFLRAMDHWIAIREARPGTHHDASGVGGGRHDSTQAAMHFNKQGAKEKKGETPNQKKDTNKEPTADHSVLDSDEPALAASNERIDSLEADNQLLRTHNGSQSDRIDELTENGKKMWYELRRQVNPIQRAKGQPEWEEGDMDKYLESLDHFSYEMEEDGEL